MKDWEVYTGAVLLGALAGMRSMAAPAVIGQLSKRGALNRVPKSLALISKPKFVTASSLLIAGEAIVDKLPFAPNRTAAGPLLGRALTGGLSGAVVCSAKKRSAWLGALLGAGAAIGAAYGAYELRKRAGNSLHIPDPLVALTEDALVGSVGYGLVARLG